MRMRIASMLVLSVLGYGSAALAQAAAKPAFEVATVRPAVTLDPMKMAAEMQSGKMPKLGAQIEGRRAEYTYMSLKDLIRYAYKLRPYQIEGPAWLGSERFDIVATMPEGAKKDDAPEMLKTLLEDRFKLQAHMETQDRPVYELVVGKGGSKLKESPAPPPVDEDVPLKPGQMNIETPDGPARLTRNPDGGATVNMGKRGTFTQKMDPQAMAMKISSENVTMEGFADMLTTVLQMGGGDTRQIVDKTGLKGHYQVSLEIPLAALMAMAKEAGFNVPGGAAAAGQGSAAAAGGTAGTVEASDPAGGAGSASVFDSVQALGLKLDPGKAPVQRLVVEHVEKAPSEN